jgi:hypothetical protein
MFRLDRMAAMIDVPTIFDTLTTRCPSLGGPVPFDYCRKLAQGLPCRRALVCWELLFPVAEYMVRVLTEEEWHRAFDSPPTPRLDVILKAAATCGSQDDPAK